MFSALLVAACLGGCPRFAVVYPPVIVQLPGYPVSYGPLTENPYWIPPNRFNAGAYGIGYGGIGVYGYYPYIGRGGRGVSSVEVRRRKVAAFQARVEAQLRAMK